MQRERVIWAYAHPRQLGPERRHRREQWSSGFWCGCARCAAMRGVREQQHQIGCRPRVRSTGTAEGAGLGPISSSKQPRQTALTAIPREKNSEDTCARAWMLRLFTLNASASGPHCQGSGRPRETARPRETGRRARGRPSAKPAGHRAPRPRETERDGVFSFEVRAYAPTRTRAPERRR